MFIKRNSVIVAVFVVLASAAAVVACSDDSSSTNPTPFGPSANNDSGASTEAGPGTDAGGCTNKPAGCFCGTPTTQQQFLNRCTSAVALPVNLTVKPATVTDIP